MKKVLSVISIVFQQFCTWFCMFISFRSLISDSASLSVIIISVLRIAALASSCLYLLSGRIKYAARFYRIFIEIVCLAEIATMLILLVGGAEVSYLDFTLLAIEFALLMTMAASMDLGKKKSYGLCIAISVITLLLLISSIVSNAGETALLSTSLGISLVRFVLAIDLFTMTAAKYKDKSNRDAK